MFLNLRLNEKEWQKKFFLQQIKMRTISRIQNFAEPDPRRNGADRIKVKESTEMKYCLMLLI